MNNSREFDVLLSFADTERDYARAIYEIASANGINVFFDKKFQHEVWGKNLIEYLDATYRERGLYVLALISSEYCAKVYPKVEIRAALDRMVEEQAEYILPVLVDDSWPSGLPKATAYLDLRTNGVIGICECLVKKIHGAHVGLIIPKTVSVPQPSIDFTPNAPLSNDKTKLGNHRQETTPSIGISKHPELYSNSNGHRFLLITTTDCERDAILKEKAFNFGDPIPSPLANDSAYYNVGSIGPHTVIHSKLSAQGFLKLGASLSSISLAINAYEPDAVILVGIAFGKDSNKQRIGDVLISREIVDCVSGKVTNGAFQPTGLIPESGEHLLKAFNSFAHSWRRTINNHSANYTIGRLLCVSGVIDDKELKNELFNREPNAIGGEMEGLGLYAACRGCGLSEWIIVKAICDWAENKDCPNKKKDQMTAAKSAVSLVKHILSQPQAFKNLPRKPGRSVVPENKYDPALQPATKTEAPCDFAPINTKSRENFNRHKVEKRVIINRNIIPQIISDNDKSNIDLYSAIDNGPDKRLIVIYGEGGIGKSYALFDCCEKMFDKEEMLPIYVPIRELSDSEHPLLSYILDDYFREAGNKDTDDLKSSIASLCASEGKKLVFFLDGLNEYCANDTAEIDRLNKDIKWLQNQTGCWVVISVRSKHTVRDFDKTTFLKVSLLSEECVKEYLKNNQSTAGIDTSNKLLLDILRLPLILNLFTQTYSGEGEIEVGRIKNHSDVFFECIKVQKLKLKSDEAKYSLEALLPLLPLKVHKLVDDEDDIPTKAFQIFQNTLSDAYKSFWRKSDIAKTKLRSEISDEDHCYEKLIQGVILNNSLYLHKNESSVISWQHELFMNWFAACGISLLLKYQPQEAKTQINAMSVAMNNHAADADHYFSTAVFLYEILDNKVLESNAIIDSAEFVMLLSSVSKMYDAYRDYDNMYKYTQLTLEKIVRNKENMLMIMPEWKYAAELNHIAYILLHFPIGYKADGFVHFDCIQQAKEYLDEALRIVQGVSPTNENERLLRLEEAQIHGNLGAYFLKKGALTKEEHWIHEARKEHECGFRIRHEVFSADIRNKKRNELLGNSYHCFATDDFECAKFYENEKKAELYKQASKNHEKAIHHREHKNVNPIHKINSYTRYMGCLVNLIRISEDSDYWLSKSAQLLTKIVISNQSFEVKSLFFRNHSEFTSLVERCRDIAAIIMKKAELNNQHILTIGACIEGLNEWILEYSDKSINRILWKVSIMSKNQILSCPQIGGDRIALIKSNIFNWLTAPSLASLAEAFDGAVPQNQDAHALAKWFLDFSERWDFRNRQKQAFDNKVGEGARWLVTNDELTDKQKSLVVQTALDLGLRNNEVPIHQDFDYIWVLGGAKLSCLLRSRLAASTISNSQVLPKAVVLLASMRPIGDGEREATDTYAKDAETEFDLFVAAARAEFGTDDDYQEERYEDQENANCSWVVRKYSQNSKGYDVYIIAAPSSDPLNRRSNSADTYEFFFERFDVPQGSSILLTTSQIYVPYQHLEAVRTIALPHNILLDTIGFPPEWGGDIQGMNEPSNYLQEIRSTVQSINRFLDLYKE